MSEEKTKNNKSSKIVRNEAIKEESKTVTKKIKSEEMSKDEESNNSKLFLVFFIILVLIALTIFIVVWCSDQMNHVDRGTYGLNFSGIGYAFIIILIIPFNIILALITIGIYFSGNDKKNIEEEKKGITPKEKIEEHKKSDNSFFHNLYTCFIWIIAIISIARYIYYLLDNFGDNNFISLLVEDLFITFIHFPTIALTAILPAFIGACIKTLLKK